MMETEEGRWITSEELDSIDRNARAYGWQVAVTGTLAHQYATGEDDHNPFTDPDWRTRIGTTLPARHTLDEFLAALNTWDGVCGCDDHVANLEAHLREKLT